MFGYKAHTFLPGNKPNAKPVHVMIRRLGQTHTHLERCLGPRGLSSVAKLQLLTQVSLAISFAWEWFSDIYTQSDSSFSNSLSHPRFLGNLPGRTAHWSLGEATNPNSQQYSLNMYLESNLKWGVTLSWLHHNYRCAININRPFPLWCHGGRSRH